jgi:hypothetical protein
LVSVGATATDGGITAGGVTTTAPPLFVVVVVTESAKAGTAKARPLARIIATVFISLSSSWLAVARER